MTRPRLLDLFSGAGGAAMGYHRAGFDVVGVDINPQPRYPFEFVQADAMMLLDDLLNGWPTSGFAAGYILDDFDAIHASPPCQDHSSLRSRAGEHGTGWMLAATRALLEKSGLPYVVENVPGADMPGALTLCGSEFGLGAGRRGLRRHRMFESNVLLMGAGGCHCAGKPTGGVYGTGGGGQMTRGWKFRPPEARAAMGIDWMTRAELAQAIPPAYTEHIGQFLLAAVTERSAAR